MTTSIDGGEVPATRGPDLLDSAVLDDPFEAYAEMHRGCPVVHLDETDLYVVGRYDDVRRVLVDPDTFSSLSGSSSASQRDVNRAMREVLAERGWIKAEVLQRTDPPVHTEHRRLLARVFTPRQVETLRPRIESIVAELLDAVAERGSMEFIGEFAIPMPGILICEQYGLPASQYATFRRWADAFLAPAQRRLSLDEGVAVAEAIAEAQQHLAVEFDKRRAQPADDLISDLVHAHEDPDDPAEPFTMEQLQGLMEQLVSGGFETTTAALGTGMWLLLRYPEQQAKLRADRSLLRNFVEESLRFDSPVSGLWRKTTCPVTLGGVEIPAGSSVMPRFAAANRDPDVFEDPDVFDIERPNAGQHLAFGQGPHFCIGAALARAELYAAFDAILDRFDDLALAEPLDEEPHEYSFFLRPLKRLPITFRAR